MVFVTVPEESVVQGHVNVFVSWESESMPFFGVRLDHRDFVVTHFSQHEAKFPSTPKGTLPCGVSN